MRAVLVVAAVVVALAGCGGRTRPTAAPPRTTTPPPATTTAKSTTSHVLAAPPPRCRTDVTRSLVTPRHAYAALAPHGVVAYRTPGGRVLSRFAKVNVNGYPTVLGVLGQRVAADCRATWLHVELPQRPNGSTGWVRAADVQLANVTTRIVVSITHRRLTLYDRGKVVLRATVAVGAPATPTPVGRYYVNQLLIPDDPSGPYGPGAVGISAFSPVLTGWAQGGPVAIHGTNEPWSIGHAVSNGCIRLPNATLSRVFKLAAAGTPVQILH